MYLGQWDVSLDPIYQKVLTELHITRILTFVQGEGTSLSTGMAAVVKAIAHVPCHKKSMLTSRAVFANHLPRISALNGSSDSTGCVRGGREKSAIILSFFIHNTCRPVFTLSS